MRTFLLAGTSLLALSASLEAADAAAIFSDTPPGLTSLMVPTTGTYDIIAVGAQGGSNGGRGGYGARLEGDVNLTQGEVLTIVVGAQGGNGSFDNGGGGGGGSFVFGPNSSPILIAGGGGGGSSGGILMQDYGNGGDANILMQKYGNGADATISYHSAATAGLLVSTVTAAAAV